MRRDSECVFFIAAKTRVAALVNRFLLREGAEGRTLSIKPPRLHSLLWLLLLFFFLSISGSRRGPLAL